MDIFRRCLAFLAAGALGASAEIFHVDQSVAGGTGDGFSWQNAFAHLQDALGEATAGDELRVTQGGYYPDEGATQLTVEGNFPQRYLTYSYRRSVWAAKYLDFAAERSTDLGSLDDWEAGETTILYTTRLDPFTDPVVERSNLAVILQDSEQLRLRVTRK